MEEKFTYEVRPRIPVRNLIPGKMINRPTVVQLDKDGVKEALRHGPVFRRFDAVHIERVTLGNLDEMHRASFEYKPVIVPVEEIPAPVAAPAMPEPEEIKKEAVEEAPIEEAPADKVVEETVGEIAEEAVEEAPVEKAIVEEVAEEAVDEDLPPTEPTEEATATVGFDDLLASADVEAPSDDAVETEETVESSEEENVTEESEEASEEAQAEEKPQYNGNKRKHH